MRKLLLAMVFIVFLKASMLENRPDAIRCGGDNGCCDGAIYFAHGLSNTKLSYYFQIYQGENRYVAFNPDGSYNSGVGYYDSRKGCQGKSLADLQKEGRSFHLYDSKINQRITKLEASVEQLKQINITNIFWEDEKSKEKWKQECKAQTLAEIKNNGLQIGSRWKIQQESQSWLVFRDIEGSKSKDSRIAFPANTYLDPK